MTMTTSQQQLKYQAFRYKNTKKEGDCFVALFFYGRRGKNRTLTDGFGDHCSTIKLLS